jgi:hypothetical protein
MKVLREHNVGWKYLNALAAIDGVTVERCTDDLPADAPGTDIAEFAQRESYVILTRDEDFFALDPDCGILFLAPNRAPQPSGVRRAVERIIEAYADDGDVREPVPGRWVWYPLLPYVAGRSAGRGSRYRCRPRSRRGATDAGELVAGGALDAAIGADGTRCALDCTVPPGRNRPVSPAFVIP